MSKYRTTGHDVLQPVKTKPDVKPGRLPENRIPVVDHKGRMRAHVGHKIGAAGVSRFVRDPKLGKHEGKTAWIGSGPSAEQKQQIRKRAALVRQARGSTA